MVNKTKEEKKEKPVELTPQQRVNMCLSEIQTALRKHNCSLISSPNFRARDDGTFSIIASAQVVANQLGS